MDQIEDVEIKTNKDLSHVITFYYISNSAKIPFDKGGIHYHLVKRDK